MNVTLVYAPFCTPTIMPYSLGYLKGFLSANGVFATCLDLNASFHCTYFKEFYNKSFSSFDDYCSMLKEFDIVSRKVYSQTNKDTLKGVMPPLFDELLQSILDSKPDVVAFSLVYNSQAFYTRCLVNALSNLGIKCIIGGPCASLAKIDCLCLNNEVELLKELGGDGIEMAKYADFSDFSHSDYLSYEPIVPVRACTSCFYGQCAFCTHHKNASYVEMPLSFIVSTIQHSGCSYVFVIDDMISSKLLDKLSDAFAPLGITWWCQLRPTTNLLPLLEKLHSSGLCCVAWGVESGSQRVLNLMKKGTSVLDVPLVLKKSSEVGILNIVYVMFGFAGETKDEFMETLHFIHTNASYIDLISVSVFGLQVGSRMFDNLYTYGIYDVSFTPRTVLSDSISYKVKNGLSQEEAVLLKKKYAKKLRSLNKYHFVLNYFKEQMLLVDVFGKGK